MKRIICTLLVVAMLFSLCSCTIGGNNTQLTMGILDDITTLDPIYAEGDGEKVISANCFEGLLRFDAEGNIDLAGATAFTAEKNGLSYTFKLNPSAQWYIYDTLKATLESSGITDFDKKITTEDYIFGIKRFIESGRTDLNAIEGAESYNPQDKNAKLGLEVIDEYTLKINLRKNDPDFLYKLAALPVYPCDEVFYKALDGIYCSTPSTTLCNGPYYIKDVTQTETVIERNPDYNGNIQTLNKSICLYNTGKETALATRLSEGSYDIAVLPSSQKIEDYEPISTSVSDIWGFAFNCSGTVSSNKKIRNLLLSTINYSEIELPSFAAEEAKRIIPDSYIAGNEVYSSFSPEEVLYTKATEQPEEKLDTILNELGTETLSVKFSVPVEMTETVQDILADWKESFGDKLNIELYTYQPDDLPEIKTEADYDFAILPITSEYHTALSIIDSVADFPCYYSAKKLRKLIKNIKNTPDCDTENYMKAEKMIVNNGVFVPLFFTDSELYTAKDVSGVYIADGGEKIYLHSGEKAEQ